MFVAMVKDTFQKTKFQNGATLDEKLSRKIFSQARRNDFQLIICLVMEPINVFQDKNVN